jgi:hypothetical protein
MVDLTLSLKLSNCETSIHGRISAKARLYIIKQTSVRRDQNHISLPPDQDTKQVIEAGQTMSFDHFHHMHLDMYELKRSLIIGMTVCQWYMFVVTMQFLALIVERKFHTFDTYHDRRGKNLSVNSFIHLVNTKGSL